MAVILVVRTILTNYDYLDSSKLQIKINFDRPEWLVKILFIAAGVFTCKLTKSLGKTEWRDVPCYL